MDIGSLFLLLALLVLAGLFVARPLIVESDAALDPALADLQAEHQRVLDALLELDGDWDLGKVPEEIYRPQRQQLLAEGAAALRAIERLPLEEAAPASAEADELEAIIAAYKQTQRKQGKRK
ncbi:MAG: hypothetical protein KF821_08675 [Anaerolineales bacterium]|nr:hypothetical protein [Anaerolineales bacterium]